MNIINIMDKLHKTTSIIRLLTVSYIVFKKFQCHTLSSNLLQCHTFRQLSVNSSVKCRRGLRRGPLSIKKLLKTKKKSFNIFKILK